MACFQSDCNKGDEYRKKVGHLNGSDQEGTRENKKRHCTSDWHRKLGKKQLHE